MIYQIPSQKYAYLGERMRSVNQFLHDIGRIAQMIIRVGQIEFRADIRNAKFVLQEAGQT
jgi:hypothetical protein